MSFVKVGNNLSLNERNRNDFENLERWRSLLSLLQTAILNGKSFGVELRSQNLQIEVHEDCRNIWLEEFKKLNGLDSFIIEHFTKHSSVDCWSLTRVIVTRRG